MNLQLHPKDMCAFLGCILLSFNFCREWQVRWRWRSRSFQWR